MSLSRKEIDEVLRQLGLTREDELDCQQCLSNVAEFAERELAGKSLTDGLKAVAHHLDLCGECREEYQALRRALEVLDE